MMIRDLLWMTGQAVIWFFRGLRGCLTIVALLPAVCAGIVILLVILKLIQGV